MNSSIKKVEAEKAISNIVGKRAWGVKVGRGLMVGLEFGNPQPKKPNDLFIHGEFSLWICNCAWRIERNGFVWSGSVDEREIIELGFSEIENRTLLDFDFSPPSLDATLKFESGIILKLFSIIAEAEKGKGQHWMLYMRGEKVLVAGPGSYLEIEDDE